MKGSRKSFLVGMLTMLLIVSMIGTASATVGKVQKTLEYRDISVSLDGEKLDLKDAKGNAVEPFMFDGTNYLPVRALAEALGLTVSWDGSTNTVVLKSVDSTESTTTEPSTGDITIAPKNALDSAKSYLSFTSFSYTGLVKQLEYEKYSHEDAVWAVDHCGADWNEQAAKSAPSYLRISSFSRDSLIAQLEFEGFTHEQAVYGVNQNGY